MVRVGEDIGLGSRSRIEAHGGQHFHVRALSESDLDEVLASAMMRSAEDAKCHLSHVSPAQAFSAAQRFYADNPRHTVRIFLVAFHAALERGIVEADVRAVARELPFPTAVEAATEIWRLTAAHITAQEAFERLVMLYELNLAPLPDSRN